MVTVKFDPTKSASVSSAAIRELFAREGVRARGDRILRIDVERASTLRWDFSFETELQIAKEMADICSEFELGRIRLVGASWSNPWVIEDRLMLKRLRHEQDMARTHSNRLSRATSEGMAFVGG